jgi:hypothetical protein
MLQCGAARRNFLRMVLYSYLYYRLSEQQGQYRERTVARLYNASFKEPFIQDLRQELPMIVVLI